MGRPPQGFLARIRELDSPFTTQEVEQLFPDLKSSSVRVYLSHAVKAGLLEQTGFKRFRHGDRPEEDRPLSPLTQEVVETLQSEFMPSAFEQLIIWSDDVLAPFVHNAFPEPFVVVEGSKQSIETAKRALASHLITEVVRGRQSLGKSIWDSPEDGDPPIEVFLVESGRLQGTRPSAHGFQVPTVGRLAAVVLQMPALLPDAVLRMMESPDFELDDVLAAAPSKRKAVQLGAFLQWSLEHRPDHPIGEQAHDLIPEMLGAA